MQLRCLTSLDFLQLKDLLLEQKTFFSLPISSFPGIYSEKSFTKLFLNLVEMKEEFVIGAVADEVLQGAILLRIVPKHQLWIVRLVVLREVLKGRSNGLHANLLDEACRFTEARGYFRHIMVVPAKHVTSKNTWNTPVRQKYTTETAERVAAGSLPNDPIYREYLFANAPFPADAVVRNSTLLPSGMLHQS